MTAEQKDKGMTIIFVYVAAIIAANLTIAQFGPSASPVVAFLLIGLTLVVRDRLHVRWEGRHLALRMGALIAIGGIASALTQPAAGRIALASVLALLVAESLDAVVFHAARALPWLRRSNLSNVVGAIADSAVFVFVAFGGPWQLVVIQAAAKIVGGFGWSLMLARRRV